MREGELGKVFCMACWHTYLTGGTLLIVLAMCRAELRCDVSRIGDASEKQGMGLMKGCHRLGGRVRDL